MSVKKKVAKEDLKEFYTVQITCWKTGKTYKRYMKLTDEEAEKFFGIDGSEDVKVQKELS